MNYSCFAKRPEADQYIDFSLWEKNQMDSKDRETPSVTGVSVKEEEIWIVQLCIKDTLQEGDGSQDSGVSQELECVY